MLQLVAISLQKLQEWDLTRRERTMGALIIRLSFEHGRKSVWIPRLECFSELTGMDKADVSTTLKSLQEKGVLQIAGPRQGGKRYTWLPSGQLLEPERVVDPRRVLAVLQEIDAANYEEDRQLSLPHSVTIEEQLSADLAKGSQERALHSPLDIPTDPGELRRRIGESLGTPRCAVGDLPTEPLVNCQQSAVGDLPTVDCASLARAQTGRTSTFPVQRTGTTGATAQQFTGNCGDGSRNELLDRLEEIIGPVEWGPPKCFGKLWRKCLRGTPVAVTAVFETLGEWHLIKDKEAIVRRGGYLFRIFQRIQRQMLRDNSSEVRAR